MKIMIRKKNWKIKKNKKYFWKRNPIINKVDDNNGRKYSKFYNVLRNKNTSNMKEWCFSTFSTFMKLIIKKNRKWQ